MEGAPGCGCEELRKAELDEEPSVRADRIERARAWQQQWRCPHAPVPATGPLPEPCSEALARVGRVCGAPGLTTCPYAALREKWVHDAAQAREWWDKGQLQLRLGHPTLALMQAIDAMNAGTSGRARLDNERLKAKQEKRNGG